MAWYVSRNSLTSAQEEYLGKNLWLQPNVNFGGTEPDPVRAYVTDDITVRLPFYIGKQLFPTQRFVQRASMNLVQPWGFTDSVKLRSGQIEMVNEVLQQLLERSSSNLNAYCSAGKTVMGAYCAAYINKFLHAAGAAGPVIITYTLTILEPQWLDTMTKFTNGRCHIVSVGTLTPPDADIYLCMMEQLPNLPPVVLNNCSMLMIDEAHLFCTEHRLKRLLAVQPRYLLLLTATRVKANGMEIMMNYLAGDHAVVKISTMPFTVWRYDTGIQPPILLNKQGKPDWNKMVDWIVNHEYRNRLIVEWALRNPTRKIAIMTTRVSHAELLQTLLTERGASVGLLCGKRRSYDACNIVIGTISKMGTGFDEKSACSNFDGHRIDCLLLVVSTKQIEQPAGRAFRSSEPHIVHFVDRGGIFRRHMDECMKWYLHPERAPHVKVQDTTEIMQLPYMEA